MSKKHRKSIAFLVVACSFFLSILIAEIILSKFKPIKSYNATVHRIPHQKLGWVLEPSIEYSFALPEGEVAVRYNSMGFRDAERSFSNQADKKRIVVLGDSFMEAYSVEYRHSFSQQLENMANTLDMDVEVINLGVGGYGTLQEYLAYVSVGRLFKPDVVLLGFYVSNDLQDNSYEIMSKLTADPLKVKSRPFLGSDSAGNWETTQVDYPTTKARFDKALKKRNSLIGRIKNNSALVFHSKNVLDRVLLKLFPKLADWRKKKSPNQSLKKLTEDQQLYFEHGVHFCEEPKEYTRFWNITSQVLSQLKREVEGNGGELIVFSVPALLEVDPKEFKSNKKLCLDAPRGYERLESVLKSHNITYVDLLPTFRKAMIEDNINMFKSDLHWNAKGHESAAKTVFSSLKQVFNMN